MALNVRKTSIACHLLLSLQMGMLLVGQVHGGQAREGAVAGGAPVSRAG